MQRVKGDGPLSAKLLILGMAPEKTEVATGRPFMGRSGDILNRALASLNIPRESVYIDNICQIPLSTFNTMSLFEIPREILAAELLRTTQLINLSLIHISEPTRLLSNSYAVFC